ncbi:MAG: ATP-binding protein [Oscillospiraceae bacterium]|nr:ATP-binding protein [Oscillospiraceae bacterium]
MKKLTLRWRLTLMTAALMAAACLLLNLFIGCSAVMSIQKIENYVVEISPVGQEAFQLDIGVFYPDLQAQLQKTISSFWVQSIFTTLAVILLSSALTWFLTGRGLAPIKKFCAKMETVQAQNLSEPLEVPAVKDEVAQMTLSFNKMLVRLDRAFTIQRQFAANAAHELRTPLAVVRTELDVLQKKTAPTAGEYAKTLQSVSEQAERLSRVVEVLLEMTGLETVERRDRISLSALTEEVLCDLAQVAEEKEVTLIQEAGDAELTGSDTLLYRAVYNLVENAVKYNRPGGSVRVEIQRAGDMALLQVTDTGIGIPRECWEEVFEPFVRVDKSRSRSMGGAGLGLALVREIAEQHGGSVKVVRSSDRGTEILLSLSAFEL